MQALEFKITLYLCALDQQLADPLYNTIRNNCYRKLMQISNVAKNTHTKIKCHSLTRMAFSS
jgi:hypothetical protein